MRHAVRGLVGGLAVFCAVALAGGPWWGAALLLVAGGNAAVALSVALEVGLGRIARWAEDEARRARHVRSDASVVSPAVRPVAVRSVAVGAVAARAR